jgi:hypothetical protein
MPSSLSAPPSQGISAENSNQKRSNFAVSEQDWSNGKNLDANREHLRTLLAIYQADLDRLLNSKPAGAKIETGH